MKKIAVMQPYFFPYLGYFSLIKNTDEFILLDTVQFIRHGWIERNRILKQNKGWLYIKAPLIKHKREALIKDCFMDNSHNWQCTILSQLQIYKKIAPNYTKVKEIVEYVINQRHHNIVSLDKAALEAVCDHLGIDNQIQVFSEMGLNIHQPNAPDEWALNICRAVGDVSEYWNPPGGKELFDKSKYSESGIKLNFQNVVLKEYSQKRTPFEPGLSIIDVLMFNSTNDVNKMLDESHRLS